MKFKTTPLKLGKTALTTAKRLQKTASVAGLSALRVAKGEKADAWLLKESFEQLGTTYIKLGQFIASTPSLFPKEYVTAFADCLDNTTPVRFEVIKSVLEEELAPMGGTEAVFSFIDPTPLASASIAQVHKATLKTGETVALKIQKPEVGTIIHTDLGVLHGTFWAMEKVLPSFKMTNLAPIVEEIKARMMAETDFIQESQHLKNFQAFLEKTNNHQVIAPKVYEHLTTKRLLTMAFFDGVSLASEDALSAILNNPHTNPSEVMSAVLDTWFLSLLMTGEFHADLHAGNLLLLKDGRVGFLDFGLVGQINPNSLKACLLLTQAMSQNDFLMMANAMIDIGMTKDRQHIDPVALADDLQSLLSLSTPMKDSLSQSSPKDAKAHAQNHAKEFNILMAQMASVGKKHGIHFPRDFALLTKQLLYFDRFMVTLAPEMDMFSGSRLQLLQS